MTPANGPSGAAPEITDSTIRVLHDKILPELQGLLPLDKLIGMGRADIVREAKSFASGYLTRQRMELNLLDQRDLVTALTKLFMWN